jgi:hypothetical protein
VLTPEQKIAFEKLKGEPAEWPENRRPAMP